ncbi:hypothetical protein L1987_09326 [Smallanthus sonchifolius]|uniref:Uncharacterized protein n=1 Tax=Smallanthus sonchifolius TaxID=185202 RepID=A0ACB9JMN0_9ASTR|nr:hypothetical protein L1987_09326 [Smallanthus sonchifolius]
MVQIPPQPVSPSALPEPKFPYVDLLLEDRRKEYVEVGVPLYEAAIKGDWKAAKPILDNHPDLIRFAITENSETLLHVAASAESTKAVQEFVINLLNMMDEKDLELQNDNYNTALGLAAKAGNIETAKLLVKKNQSLIEIPGSKYGMPLYMAALYAKPDMVRYLYDISRSMSGPYWYGKNRGWVLLKCVDAEIFDVAIKIVRERPELMVNKLLVTDVLLALARNTQAFERSRPVLSIPHRNGNESGILQLLKIIWEKIAIIPQSEIDNILQGPEETTTPKSEIDNILKGPEGNTMPKSEIENIFLGPERNTITSYPSREVEQMIPPSYRQMKNKDGKTPQDLFARKQADLVSKGEEWMNNYMLVATLIATIVFAAAFTLPGGYKDNKGIPFYREELSLIIFVVSDAVSLISSSTSVLIFLSILTSRYAQYDFMESLPVKIIFGLATLFLSIVTMMVAFSASFFVLYHNNLKWVPITVTSLAGIPVLLFAKLQFKFLVNVLYVTYRSRYLFKPKKHILYY